MIQLSLRFSFFRELYLLIDILLPEVIRCKGCVLMNCSMHRDRMHNMDEMFGSMFHGDPMMALTDGRDGGHHQRHREDMHGHELQSGRSRGTDIAPYGGQYNPFGFMSSMMSNMHGMMENAFQQTVCSGC